LDAINSPELDQQGNELVSASLTFVTANERWSISGGATNLTNSTYLLSGYQDLDAIGGATGTFSRPREWFAKVKMKF
jgi:iron complex outermembrane receptor protein